MQGEELDWVGPVETYHVSSETTGERWLSTDSLLELENHGKFSVRVYDPRIRSLLQGHRTVAVLPKSKLREIHALIGRYLENAEG